MRNKIFHNFIKSREDLHSKTMSKLKPDNNLIMELEYPDFPGPGFYNQKIIPKHTSFMSTAHNFGSTSPKFKNLKQKMKLLGLVHILKKRININLNSKQFFMQKTLKDKKGKIMIQFLFKI